MIRFIDRSPSRPNISTSTEKVFEYDLNQQLAAQTTMLKANASLKNEERMQSRFSTTTGGHQEQTRNLGNNEFRRERPIIKEGNPERKIETSIDLEQLQIFGDVMTQEVLE